MKRRILALLLAVLLLTTLTAAVFAEDATTPVKGAYDLVSKTGFKLTVKDVTSDGGFYANANTFTLTCDNLTGPFSLVLLLSGDDAVPTESNLFYIDQQSVSDDGTATFTLLPKDSMKEGTDGATYTIYISTSTAGPMEAASFKFGTKPPYTLGDINNDTEINAEDAVLALRYAVQLTDLSDTQKLAADVNKDGDINAEDAVQILRYAVKLITSF